MKGREIKLKLKGDDLTVLLRNEEPLYQFLDAIANFGKCTGLLYILIKQKCYFWGTQFFPHLGQTISKIEIKKAVKFLVQFLLTTDNREIEF